MVKQTIAIVGIYGSRGSVLARKLVSQDRYRLLLIVDGENQWNSLPDEPAGDPALPAAELVDCLTDGCWEADIILADIPYSGAAAAVKKMKEVATQKIVFVFSGAESDRMSAFAHGRHWQTLLPYSKVVTGFSEPDGTEVFFSGQDNEAVGGIAALMDNLGYQSIILSKNKN